MKRARTPGVEGRRGGAGLGRASRREKGEAEEEEAWGSWEAGEAFRGVLRLPGEGGGQVVAGAGVPVGSGGRMG